MLVTIHLVARLFRLPVLRIDGDIRLTERAFGPGLASRTFASRPGSQVTARSEEGWLLGQRLAQAESMLA